ncbi:MAG: hypothetical protein K0S51_2589, partial [Bacillales bacterium]|nr:hypothetical protein [Bacillales bacterium]
SKSNTLYECSLSSFEGFSFILSGGDGKEVTPVLIPNTEVKLFSANGSWGFPPVRVGRRQAQKGHYLY